MLNNTRNIKADRGELIEEVWEEDGKYQVFFKNEKYYYYKNDSLIDICNT